MGSMQAVRSFVPFSPPYETPVRLAQEESLFGAAASVRAFGRDEIIYLEGDPAEHVFLVRTGLVKIYKLLRDGRRQITGFLFPGDLFGLQTDGAYVYSVEALTETTVEAVLRRRLEATLDADPRKQRQLLALFSNELAMAQEQLLVLGRRTARERVAWFLLMLVKRWQLNGQSKPSVRLDMYCNEIADYLGLTTETVSRMLTGLKREGIVRAIGPRLLQVADLNALALVVDGERAAGVM